MLQKTPVEKLKHKIDWKKIFANFLFDKRLIFKICKKNPLTTQEKKAKPQFLKNGQNM